MDVLSAARRLPAQLMLLMVAAALPAQQPPQVYHRLEDLDHRTMIRLREVDGAGPPRVYEDLVVLTHRPPRGRYARYVAAAFAHEGYRTLHVYDAVRQGDGHFFILAYQPPPELERLEYRIVVDGVWMVDPQAPDRVVGADGIEVARVSLPSQPVYRYDSPVAAQEGFTFQFSLDPRVTTAVRTVKGRSIPIQSFAGRRVALVGSFNGWDPFSHPMTRDENGRFSLTLRLPRGAHYYYFLVDGERVVDPLNEQRAFDPTTGGTVSMLRVTR